VPSVTHLWLEVVTARAVFDVEYAQNSGAATGTKGLVGETAGDNWVAIVPGIAVD
jgi:hypothetical protein